MRRFYWGKLKKEVAKTISFQRRPTTKPQRLSSLNPEKLSIGFTDSSVIILQDGLFLENISDEEALTPLERGIATLFPRNLFTILLIDHVNNSFVHSTIEYGVKRRTKAIIKGEVFLDFGDLLKTEKKVSENFLSQIQTTSPSMHALINEKTKDDSEPEKSKIILGFRDLLFVDDNELSYTTGGLDEVICEQFLELITEQSAYEIEANVDFVQFMEPCLDFGIESLKDHILTAWTRVYDKSEGNE